MLEISTGEILAFFGLLLSASGLWFGFVRWQEGKLETVRTELRSEFSDQLKSLDVKMDDIMKNYVHKEELRQQVQFQTEVMKEVKAGQERLNDRFDKFMLMQMSALKAESNGG